MLIEMKKYLFLLLFFFAVPSCFSQGGAPGGTSSYIIGVSTNVIEGFSGTVYTVEISTSQLQQLFDNLWNVSGISNGWLGQLTIADFSFMFGVICALAVVAGFKVGGSS